MSRQIKEYRTRKEMEIGKASNALKGFSSIHTNFIGNNQANGYRVTYDNADNTPPPRKIKTLTKLNQGLKDKILSHEDLMDLIQMQALKLNPTTRWENFRALFTG